MNESFHNRLETLYRINQSLVNQEDLNSFFATITNEIKKLGQYQLICLFLLEGDQLILRSREGELKDEIPAYYQINVNNSPIGKAILLNEPILENNLYASREFCIDFNISIQSMYCIPLTMNQHSIGVIVLGSIYVNAFSSEDIKYLNALASSATIAIFNAYNYHILKAYGRISRITTTNSEFQQSYPILIEELLKVIRFDGLKFTFPHPFRNRELSCFGIYLNGKSLPLEQKILPIEGSATKQILNSGEAILSKHSNEFTEDYFNLPSPFQTALRVPIIDKGKVIGVVHFYNEKENAYNDWEIKTISELVMQLGPAIGNIIEIYFKNTIKKIKDISHKAANALISTDQLENVLKKYADTAKRYLGLSHFFIWILDEERLMLRLVNDKDPIDLPITNMSTVVKCFLEKKIFIFKDQLDLSRLDKRLNGISKSGLLVPLCDQIENECVGVALITDDDSYERFNEKSIEAAKEYLRPLGTHILRHIKNSQLEKANLMMIRALTVALDKKDAETKGHSQRVMDYSLAIAKRVGIKENAHSRIKWGALLHDIGKIGIPDAILLKPDRLTDDEWDIMRKHPDIGYEMVQSIQFLEGAIDIILYHHERFDGKGYPYGLSGEEIPLPARIFAIADAFDAITSKRPYKEPMSIEVARDIIKKDTGTHFCPTCAKAFLSIPISELENIKSHQLETLLIL